MQAHHALRQKSPERESVFELTPSRSSLTLTQSRHHPETASRVHYADRVGNSPLRQSSGAARSRGLLTTDNRRSGLNESAIADTDLYYSTGKSSADLMVQAMAVHRENKGIKQSTTPRRMLHVGGSSQESATPSAISRRPVAVIMEQSSYDRSSNKSRGLRAFEKSSYKKSFPLRAVETEKMHTVARVDVEARRMQLAELGHSRQTSNSNAIFIDDNSDSLGSLSVTEAAQSVYQGSALRTKSRSRFSQERIPVAALQESTPHRQNNFAASKVTVINSQQNNQSIIASLLTSSDEDQRSYKSKSPIDRDIDLVWRQQSRTTAPSTQLESELMQKSAGKTTTMQSVSLQNMQRAIEQQQSQAQQQHSPLRQKSSTPRHRAAKAKDLSPECRTVTEESEHLQASSLKQELGIVDSDDASPHRFFDWVEEDDGYQKKQTFTTIEDQIRQRQERLRVSEIEEKEQDTEKRQRRRERKSRRRAELEQLMEEQDRIKKEQKQLETLKYEKELSRSLSKKREALEELSVLKSEHEDIVEQQRQLQASLTRKQKLEELDDETDWQLHQSSIAMVSQAKVSVHGSIVKNHKITEESMDYSESGGEQQYQQQLSNQDARGGTTSSAEEQEDGPNEAPFGEAPLREDLYDETFSRESSLTLDAPFEQQQQQQYDQQRSIIVVEDLKRKQRRRVNPHHEDKLPFPFQLQEEVARLADPKAQIGPTRAQESIRRRIQQIHDLEQEKHKLERKREEIKRLEHISQSPEPKQRRTVQKSSSKSRSASQGRHCGRSSGRRPFVTQNESHQKWTNAYSRQSVHWDAEEQILWQDKQQGRKLKKNVTACCGNSPSRSHTNYCHIPKPGQENITAANSPLRFKVAEVDLTNKKRSSRSRSKVMKPLRKKSKSAAKLVRGQRHVPHHGQSIDSVGPINIEKKSQRSQQQHHDQQQAPSYFMGSHKGNMKVKKIARRIHQIAENSDPQMRDRVLNEATVQFNGHTMTLRQFLDNWASEIHSEDAQYAPQQQQQQPSY